MMRPDCGLYIENRLQVDVQRAIKGEKQNEHIPWIDNILKNFGTLRAVE